MQAEQAAILCLVLYAVAGAGVLAWRIRRCGAGPVVWALYGINSLYTSLFFHWRSDRRPNIPGEGPALLISNHRSPVDPMFVWKNHHLSSPRRRIRCISFLMAREYYEVRALNWMFRALKSIPVERDGHDMKPARAALRQLQAGDLVGVFPEGRINLGKPGAPLLPGDPGVAWLALRSRVPVIPIYIHNSPDGTSMVAPFLHRTRVRVSYGDPIDLSAYFDRRIDRALLQEVTDLLMARLEALGRSAPAAADSENDGADDGAERRTLPLKRALG